jgi:hypothetical protein
MRLNLLIQFPLSFRSFAWLPVLISVRLRKPFDCVLMGGGLEMAISRLIRPAALFASFMVPLLGLAPKSWAQPPQQAIVYGKQKDLPEMAQGLPEHSEREWVVSTNMHI